MSEVGDEPAVELLEFLTPEEVEPVDKESLPFTESVSDALPVVPVAAGGGVAADVPEVLDALAGFAVVLVPGVADTGEDPEAVLEGALIVVVVVAVVLLGVDVPGAAVAGSDVGFGVLVATGEGVPELGAGVVVIGDVHVIVWPVHVWLLLAQVSVGRLGTHSIQQISADPAWSVHVHLAEQSEASVSLWP